MEIAPEAFGSALPEELRTGLANAVIALDGDRIATSVHAISKVDPALGGVLALLADRLAYTPILRALQPGDGKAAGVG